MSTGVLVVGASHAGVSAAARLRDIGYGDPITIVSAEDRLPYERPPLSKKYLLGKATDTDILLRSPGFYEDCDIRVITSERISRVDLDAGFAESVSMQFEFKHLVLATGASPRMLQVPGHGLPGIFYLRTAADAALLAKHLTDANNVVIVGGGYIGLEAAGVMRALGKRTTVVEAATSLIPRTKRPQLANYLADLHRSHEVGVEIGAAVEGFLGGAEGVRRVVLGSGQSLAADLVIVGIGITPNVDLAESMGLEVEGGVVVDITSATSSQRVVAAGDVTALKDASPANQGLVRHESVHNATVQGAAAARTIMGLEPAPFEAPWFWSDQFNVKIQMAGQHSSSLDAIVRGDPESRSFSILYLNSDSQVRAIDCVNRPGDFLAARRAITLGQSIDRARVSDTTVPLRELAR
jgi:3-phenylpropionate/trans-cinnamate dioxygenase ferredoxin reductase component